MKKKYLGKLIISATGLRKMANHLQKEKKSKGDIEVKGFVCQYSKNNKTFGIEL